MATDSGVITSHEAINLEGRNPNCTWTVMASDPGNHVTLTITQLVVSQLNSEANSECTDNNSVEVYEGMDSTGTLLGRYCSNALPLPITSHGSTLHINMVSPYNNFHGWFSAAYSVINSGQ